MKIIYFSWVRDRTGVAAEDVEPPAGVSTVEKLVEWLKGRSDGHARAFADPGVIRAAVNQEYVKMDHAVGPADEVAFFPPVTGG